MKHKRGDQLRYASMLMHLGKRDAYEGFRRTTIDSFTGTTNPVAAEQISKSCLLMPAADELLNRMENIYEVLQRGQRRSTEAAWSYLALALFEYRRGAWTASQESCEQVFACEYNFVACDAAARAILAMNYFRLGKLEVARKQLESANEILDETRGQGLTSGVFGTTISGTPSWLNWEIAAILRDEAAALINGTPLDETEVVQATAN